MTKQSDGMEKRNGAGQTGALLDDLFAAARDAPVLPSEALVARVLADALAEQPRMGATSAMTAPGPRERGPGRAALGVWQRLVWALGGAGSVAGMGTAALAGLYIGFAQPGGIGGLGEAVLGAPLETVELVPGIDTLLLEGN